MACASCIKQVGDESKEQVIAVITDSRGGGLKQEIDKPSLKGFNVKVLVYPGKGIIKAVKEAESLLNWWRPQKIYVMCGICDVTYKDKDTKKVSSREADIDKALDSYLQSVDIVTHFIKVLMDGSRYKFIFTEIIGMNIATYNNTEHPDPQQAALNEIVDRINGEVIAWNKSLNMMMPWVARIVHRNKKNGKKNHRYQKLAQDGLHLTDEIRAAWASELCQAMSKNID